MFDHDIIQVAGVGTLKDGYVRNVPLPQVPRIQSAKLIAPSRCIIKAKNNLLSSAHGIVEPLKQSTVLSEQKKRLPP